MAAVMPSPSLILSPPIMPTTPAGIGLGAVVTGSVGAGEGSDAFANLLAREGEASSGAEDDRHDPAGPGTDAPAGASNEAWLAVILGGAGPSIPPAPPIGSVPDASPAARPASGAVSTKAMAASGEPARGVTPSVAPTRAAKPGIVPASMQIAVAAGAASDAGPVAFASGFPASFRTGAMPGTMCSTPDVAPIGQSGQGDRAANPTPSRDPVAAEPAGTSALRSGAAATVGSTSDPNPASRPAPPTVTAAIDPGSNLESAWQPALAAGDAALARTVAALPASPSIMVPVQTGSIETIPRSIQTPVTATPSTVPSSIDRIGAVRTALVAPVPMPVERRQAPSAIVAIAIANADAVAPVALRPLRFADPTPAAATGQVVLPRSDAPKGDPATSVTTVVAQPAIDRSVELPDKSLPPTSSPPNGQSNDDQGGEAAPTVITGGDAVATAPGRTAVSLPAAAPANAVSAPTIADRPAPVDLSQRHWPTVMVDRIEAMRDAANAADTRIRLVPDVLGGIDVTLRRHDAGMVVMLKADRVETQTMLDHARPTLVATAAERGITLAEPSSPDLPRADPPTSSVPPSPAATSGGRRDESSPAGSPAGDAAPQQRGDGSPDRRRRADPKRPPAAAARQRHFPSGTGRIA